MKLESILIEPVVTEKTNAMKEDKRIKYAFRVMPEANKFQVMDAVRKLFNVKPVSCNIAWVKSKKKTSRTKSGFREGERAGWKKAIVTLSPGEKIDIFEGV
ncbi:MAG: 50S ribosomal protein L23 [Spirochaetes bacterium]|nr:50S ribosomal protein L23 [Spirochaetota bacterium]